MREEVERHRGAVELAAAVVRQDDPVDTAINQTRRVRNVLNPFHHKLAGPHRADEVEVVVADRGVHRRVEQLPHGAAGGAERGELQLRSGEQAVFAIEEHVEVEATWGIYQRSVAAYREPDKKKAKAMMQAVIDTITSGVPVALVEVRKLGRTMRQCAADILAFFDRPGTSNGPTEATNGRLEHLRGSALGFRNLTHYIARSLLEAGGFRPALHA